MTLGVTHNGKNTNFAVAVGDTGEVLLKLYKNTYDTEPEYVIRLNEDFKTGNIFAVTVKNFIGKGYTYLYEAKGVSFIDPYARLISGREVYGKTLSEEEKKLVRAYVCGNSFARKDKKLPKKDFSELIIYQLHVRGFTKAAGGIHAGTYRGVIDKIPYLKELGINSVLLMPCMEYNEIFDSQAEVGVPEFVASKFYRGSTSNETLIRMQAVTADYENNSSVGITLNESFSEDESCQRDIPDKLNFWGYAPFYYFFAPKASYAYQPEKADYEFKLMISKLHEAGIEVMMEVHIPEYVNRSMISDALRYWVCEYEIDGFKLNLERVDSVLIAGDPYLSSAKFIGNGWDTNLIYPREYTPEAKKLAEYNGNFSRDIRRFLKGDEGMTGNVSKHFYENSGKCTRVNYIADHNGFTLADLYMYDMKHNEANGERGRDGTDVNYSFNCGEEGPSSQKKIKELRLKMRKNAAAMLLLSQGVPLVFSGDEIGNSQGGNNNAYCQDNETGWTDWKKTKLDSEFFEFVKKLISLRKKHPVLRNKIELKCTDYLSSGKPDVSLHSNQAWYPDYDYDNRCIAVMYSGDYALVDKLTKDEDFYIAFNMNKDDKEFEIPIESAGKEWVFELSTDKSFEKEYACREAVTENIIKIPGRSVVVFKSRGVK